MLSKSWSNPEAWIFMLEKYTNLFFIGKNVLIVMVSVLINKDVFEPSYNDLKFTVQNHSPNKKLCLHQPNNIESLYAYGTSIVL